MTRKNILIWMAVLLAIFLCVIFFDTIFTQVHALTTPDCRVCHTGGTFPSIAQRHHSLNGSCAYCHREVIGDAPDYDCLSCHTTNPINPFMTVRDVTTAHTPLHNKTDVPDPVTCNLSCHNPAIIIEHSKYPLLFDTPSREMNCERCHWNTNSDPTQGATNVQNTIALGSGSAGQTVFCDDCHVNLATVSHEAAHDKVSVNTPDCLQCHDNNVVPEHLSRGWSCATCHAGETVRLDPAVVLKAITDGSTPNNQVQLCSTCHSLDAGAHQAAHDQTFLPTNGNQDCTMCHVANVVTEHVTNQSLDCAVCHTSTRTDIIEAINKGSYPANSPVYCIDCHNLPGNDQGMGHSPITKEPWSQCLNCHSSIGFGQTIHAVHVSEAGNNCSTCHTPSPDCTLCHNNNSTTPRINIVGPGALAHDNHTNTYGVTCTICHISNVPGSDPIIEPYNQCDSCHATQYGQLTHNAHLAATNNNCSNCHTQTPTCTQCHTIAGPTALTHDNHTNTYGVTCTTCHVSGVPGGTPIPAPFNTCDQCHTTLQPNDLTHNSHQVAATNTTTGVVDCTICHSQQASCNQCHTAGDHSQAHDNAGIPSPDCSTCHAADIVIEHVDTRGFSCATCHENSASNVVEAISSGISGNFVACYDCHGTNNHHVSVEAQTGNCTFCHADQRLGIDPNAPSGQLACRQCHINNSGYVQTSAPAPSHSFNTNGNIKDFGACFACHTPVPYHAKPVSRPRDCTVSTSIAPGKGSFNLFYSEFGGGSKSNPRNKSCQSQENNYSTPNISFNMVSIVDYLNSNIQFTVPTFGTGSGGSLPNPDIYLDPGNINFGSVAVNEFFTLNSVIRNLGNSVLTISNISTGSGTSSEFTFTTQTFPFMIPAGGSRTIPISYQPMNSGTDNGSLVISSNDPDESTTSISLSGTGETSPVPDINLNPQTLNYGKIKIGRTASRTVSIQNLGTAQLTVNAIQPCNGTSPEFSLSLNGPITIKSKTEITLSVNFTPTDEGNKNGCFVISSNDPDETTLELGLEAVGVSYKPSLLLHYLPTILNAAKIRLAKQQNEPVEPIIEPYNQCDSCHMTQYGQQTHNVHIKVTNNDCAVCHSPKPTCTQCHAISGPNSQIHDKHTRNYDINCSTCHGSGDHDDKDDDDEEDDD